MRDGVTSEEIDLFAFAAARQKDVEEKDAFCISVTEEDEENARSAVESFLHQHLEALPSTKGLFELNGRIEIPFGVNPYMEVDFLSRAAKLAVEIDGSRHFDDKNAYRRD